MVAAEKRKQKRKVAVGHKHAKGHRLKFAMCGRLCKGDTACMAKCLKNNQITQ